MTMNYKIITFGAIALAMAMSSCSSDDPVPDASNEKDERYSEIAAQYLDNTVIITYQHLASETKTLVENLKALKDNKTDASVAEACATFLDARAWWEKSEAFLYGAASDFGIDPHIDSWPLDRAGLESQLANVRQLEFMAADDGDAWAGTYLGPALLGFHGIEYIIFSDGRPKAAAAIHDNELTYVIAVAGDLRNKCWQLYLSWAGEDAVDSDVVDKVDGELELPFTTSGGMSYKENMLNAGKAGSTYRTWTDAVQAIVDGCATIADEVGTQKIGKPYSGDDINYIESPYSHKSITDFHDNIVSIENAYMGGIEGLRNENKSLHGYLSKKNDALDARCVDAIDNAKAKIASMKAPFVENYSAPSAKAASVACQELRDVLMEVKAELAK